MATQSNSKNIKWIDGLRGVASFTVVCTHLARAFDYGLFQTRDFPDAPIRWLQWPFIRLLFQGKVGVAVFAMLTGFVCSLKPLRLARSGRQQEALTTISKSALRRAPRLMIPATVALLIAWTVCQFNGFLSASRADADWLRYSSTVPLPTLRENLWRLVLNFRWTWQTDDRMEYDDNQWALLPFLKGSFIVFLLSAALIYTKFSFRLLIYFLFMTYWWQNPHYETETFGLLMVFGMFLSDLSQHPAYVRFLTDHPKLTTRLSVIPIFTGLYVASFPTETHAAEWTQWSTQLLHLGDYIFPELTDFGKRFASLGMMLVAFGLLNNVLLKDVLSNQFFLWLGKNSFAVYLVHGTLLRSVLVWALYGFSGLPPGPLVDNDGNQLPPVYTPRRFTGILFLVIVAVWLGLVYYCAHLWTTYVDTLAARITALIEEYVSLREGEVEEDYSDEKFAIAPLLG